MTYDIGCTWYGAHVGVGQEFDVLDNKTVDVYAKYFYSHLGSADEGLSSGETYHFDSVDSSRGRVGARLTSEGENFGFHFGLAYEYQFDGKARGSYKGLSTLTPSLEGGSGIAEVGVEYRPKADSAFSLGFDVTGMTGTQEGVEGTLKLIWKF